jgi:hypothetical protein
VLRLALAELASSLPVALLCRTLATIILMLGPDVMRHKTNLDLFAVCLVSSTLRPRS